MMPRSIYLLLIICGLIATGCSSDEDVAVAEVGLLRNQIIAVDGIERTYNLYVPTASIDKPAVLLLHGNGGSADEAMGIGTATSPTKIWLDVAEREGALLIVPDGTVGPSGRQGWNDCRADAAGQPDADDVTFILELIDRVQNEFGYDPDRLFVSGTSNGGFMAHRLAMQAPERWAAMASSIALQPVQSECPVGRRPLEALFILGTEDPIVPYTGGEMAFDRGEVISGQAMIGEWRDRNAISDPPALDTLPDLNTNDGSRVVRHRHTGGLGGREVVLYEMVGAGHVLPSRVERYGAPTAAITGRQNGDIEMAEVVWAFFAGR